jgi:AcrR family transcriptional regulator
VPAVERAAASVGTRAEKARATRRRMLEAAQDLFVTSGYAQTTIAAIAERAGVNAQTIYFTFSTKHAILKELIDVAVAGDQEAIPTLQRAWVRRAIAEPDAAAQLRRHVHGVRMIYQRVGPLLEVVRNATSLEPDIASLWRTITRQRHAVQTELAKALITKPGYRGPADPAELADILFTLLSPDVFHLLVVDRRWPLARSERWMAHTLCVQLTDTTTSDYDASIARSPAAVAW